LSPETTGLRKDICAIESDEDYSDPKNKSEVYG